MPYFLFKHYYSLLKKSGKRSVFIHALVGKKTADVAFKENSQILLHFLFLRMQTEFMGFGVLEGLEGLALYFCSSFFLVVENEYAV